MSAEVETCRATAEFLTTTTTTTTTTTITTTIKTQTKTTTDPQNSIGYCFLKRIMSQRV